MRSWHAWMFDFLIRARRSVSTPALWYPLMPLHESPSQRVQLRVARISQGKCVIPISTAAIAYRRSNNDKARNLAKCWRVKIDSDPTKHLIANLEIRCRTTPMAHGQRQGSLASSQSSGLRRERWCGLESKPSFAVF